MDLLFGDCLELLPNVKDSSVSLILTDLPYGTTQNTWDKLIDLDRLWSEYWRVIKPNGAIVLFAQPPFDKLLACSNIKNFRYEWIWHKTTATGHLNAKRMPMKAHENILVFYKKLPTYNPQKTTGHKPVNSYTKHQCDGTNYGNTKAGISGGGSTERYPTDILTFKTDKQKSSLHPTQKPVDLLRYLIRTYSNEGDVVLDSCMGSGSTGVAAVLEDRLFVGMELDEKYFRLAENRILQTVSQSN